MTVLQCGKLLGLLVPALSSGAAMAQDRFQLIGELPRDGGAAHDGRQTAAPVESGRARVVLRSSSGRPVRVQSITGDVIIGLAVPRDGSLIAGVVGTEGFSIRRDRAGYMEVSRPGYAWRTIADSADEETVDVIGGTTFSFGGEPLVQFPAAEPITASAKNG